MDALVPDRSPATGCLLGLAVGDAIGAPLEFHSRASATAAVHAGLEMTGGGVWQPGEWTDDTAMALCLADCLIATGLPLELDDLAARYAAWAASGPKDIGTTTRAALTGATTADAAQANAEAYHERAGKSAGNGTVMRVAPLGLVNAPLEAVVQAAREDAKLTHWDPVAGDASAALCAALRALRDRDDPVAAARREDREQHEKLSSALELVHSGDLAAVGALAGGSEGGTCWAALATGLAALTFDSFEEGVGWAISHGFDTDTNAAVAGALLGCRDGAAAIPKRWRELLHDQARIGKAAERLTAMPNDGS